MLTKIGIKAVETMPPKSMLWDSAIRGFNARRQFSNAITYSVFYRTIDGQQRWHKIGRHGVFTPEQARNEARRILMAAALGQDPSGERMALRNSMTMEQLCDEYVADMQSGRIKGKKESTIKSDISRIATHIKPVLGKRKVSGVTQEDAEQFMRDLPPGSARRVTGLLGAIFSYSVKRKLRPDNPVHGLDKPAEVKRMRRLSDAEYAQLWRTLENGDNAASDVFLLLAVSGWRSSEAKNLKWSEVDLERRVATLGDTKTGLSVRPLSDAAVEIIQRQERKGPFVFDYQHGKPISNLTPHFNKLRMAKDVTPHTLRHSLASLAADLGLPDHTISGLLGHARQGITSRYMHLGDKALIEASDLVANETLRLMRA
jgi:integrase